MDLVETYRDKPELIKHMLVYDAGIVNGVRFYEANGLKASGATCLIEGTDKTDMCYEMKL